MGLPDRCDDPEGDPFGLLVDDAVDLGPGQDDSALVEQRDEVGGVVKAPGSHHEMANRGVCCEVYRPWLRKGVVRDVNHRQGCRRPSRRSRSYDGGTGILQAVTE